MAEEVISLRDWVQDLPDAITTDPLWTIEAYRLALYVADVAWKDVTKLVGDRRTRSLSDQLYRALGSISANIEEGYSRGSDRDRARFYEYALGSAREARGWYYRGRHVLGEELAVERMEVLTQVIRLLLKMSRDQRGYSVHEVGERYGPSTNDQEFTTQPHL